MAIDGDNAQMQWMEMSSNSGQAEKKMQKEARDKLLEEIRGGRTVFQTISSESCALLGIDDAEKLSEEQAGARKTALEQLERSGSIKLFKSASGFYTVL